MKVWERDVIVLENQCGFMPGRSITKAIHLVRRLMEHYSEKKGDLHMVFIDLEETYDKFFREALWRCLEIRGSLWRILELSGTRMMVSRQVCGH